MVIFLSGTEYSAYMSIKIQYEGSVRLKFTNKCLILKIFNRQTYSYLLIIERHSELNLILNITNGNWTPELMKNICFVCR